MKKRSIMASNKAKRNSGRLLLRKGNGGSLLKRPETEPAFSSLAVHVSVVHHPMMQGIGSLGNVSGGYVRFENYLRGHFVHDVRKDWQRVGDCLSASLKSFR